MLTFFVKHVYFCAAMFHHLFWCNHINTTCTINCVCKLVTGIDTTCDKISRIYPDFTDRVQIVMKVEISRYNGTMFARIQNSLTIMQKTRSDQTKLLEYRRQRIMKMIIIKQFVSLSQLQQHWEDIGGHSNRFNETVLLNERTGIPCMILNFGLSHCRSSCISGKYVCLRDVNSLCLPTLLSTMFGFINTVEKNTFSLLNDICRLFKFGIGSANKLNQRFCVSMLKTIFMACFGESSVNNNLRVGYLAAQRKELMEAALLFNKSAFANKIKAECADKYETRLISMQARLAMTQNKMQATYIVEWRKFTLQAEATRLRNSISRMKKNRNKIIQDSYKRILRLNKRQYIHEVNRLCFNNGTKLKGNHNMQYTVAAFLSTDLKNNEVVKSRKNGAMQLQHNITYDKLMYFQSLYFCANRSAGKILSSQEAVKYISENKDELEKQIKNIGDDLVTTSCLRNYRSVGQSRTTQAKKIRDGPGLELFLTKNKSKCQEIKQHPNKYSARRQLYDASRFAESLSKALRDELSLTGGDAASYKKYHHWEGVTHVSRNSTSITTQANVNDNKFGALQSSEKSDPDLIVRPIVFVCIKGKILDNGKVVRCIKGERMQFCTIAPKLVCTGNAYDIWNTIEHSITKMTTINNGNRFLVLEHLNHGCDLTYDQEMIVLRIRLRLRVFNELQNGFSEASDMFVDSDIDVIRRICCDSLMKFCCGLITCGERIIINLNKIFYKIKTTSVFYRSISNALSIAATMIHECGKMIKDLNECNIDNKVNYNTAQQLKQLNQDILQSLTGLLDEINVLREYIPRFKRNQFICSDMGAGQSPKEKAVKVTSMIWIIATDLEILEKICNAGGDSKIQFAEQTIARVKEASGQNFATNAGHAIGKFSDVSSATDFIRSDLNDEKYDDAKVQAKKTISYSSCDDFQSLVHGVDSMGSEIACSVFPNERDEVDLDPLFSQPIVDLLSEGIKDHQHPFHGVIEWLLNQLESHSLLQAEGMRMAINMEDCQLGYGTHDCELDHTHNLHHDGNIGNFLSPQPLQFCENSQKFLYKQWEFKKIETTDDIESFSNGIPTVEIKKYLSLNSNYLYSKNLERINALNPTDPVWPDDIGFDEKSTKEIENLYRKVGPNKEIVERYIIQQLQLQSKRAKYHRNMNKELKKFYVKNKNILLYFYTDLKGEPEEYDIQLNQLLMQFVEKNKTDLKVVVEWIVKEIEKEEAEEAVDEFLEQLVA